MNGWQIVTIVIGCLFIVAIIVSVICLRRYIWSLKYFKNDPESRRRDLLLAHKDYKEALMTYESTLQ